MDNQNAICINVQLNTSPFVTVSEFCRITGLKPGYVYRLNESGKLPIKDREGKQKGKVLINMVELSLEAIQGVQTPILESLKKSGSIVINPVETASYAQA